MTIGEKIVKLRKQAGMSQEAFSEKLGISRQAVSKWENGTAQPTNENLAQIARLFDVTISSLLDDEDINMGINSTLAAEQLIENPDNIRKKKNEKSFKFGVLLQGIAIIILGITNIIQAYMIGTMKDDVAAMRQKVNEYSSLKSQINSLENRIYSMPYYSAQNNENFTDYHYKIVNYDRSSNTATISFSVVPKDYTRQTVAQIVIKCGNQDYSIPAVLENNIFTATADIVCDDNMSVYLYLTEEGKTRSFVLDYLPNPADAYTMKAYLMEIGGDWKVGGGKLKADAKIGCTVGYVFNEDFSKSSYPVKGVIEIYTGEEILFSAPFQNIMDYDFIQDGKELLSDGAMQVADGEITFYQYFDLDLKNENITSPKDIDIVITIVDNQGYEYQLKENFGINLPEEVTYIAPEK